MNKLLLTVGAALLSLSVFSQVLFNETFDGIAGPTAGGAGTYAFPSGWLLRNVDNRTPAASVAYVNEAWERREDFANNVIDSCAFSTSWYTPAGPADDWMWTPPISLTGNALLTWNALTYDAAFPDGYEVRIMTQSSTPGGPTGGTGVIGNQVTNSTVLFTIPSENSTWTARTVDLSAYSGETVWIAYRNVSNDKFILLIDDVKVELIPSTDAELTSIVNTEEYTIIPLAQAVSTQFSGTISNTGSTPLTNVTLHVDIYDALLTNVYSGTSAASSLGVGANALFTTTTNFTPTAADTYTIDYYISTTEIDLNSGNDSISRTMVISDSVYARDNGIATGTLGIGAGNGGQLGQTFSLPNADVVTSISFFIGNATGNMVGQPLSGGIWATNGAGVPTTLLVSTETMIMDATANTFWTLPITGGSFNLAAGDYVAVVNEVDSNVTIGTATSIFTLGKTWVNWPTIPGGTWDNNEAFAFNVSYLIRPNFSDNCVNTSSTLVQSACDSYTWTENGATYTSGGLYTTTIPNALGCDSLITLDLTITTIDLTTTTVGNSISANQSGATYQWIDCSNNAAIAGETASSFTATTDGDYAVIVTIAGCSDTSSCVSILVSGINENSMNQDFKIYPNPTKNAFNIRSSNGGSFVVTNELGQKVLAFELTSLEEKTIEISNLQSGIYFIVNKDNGATQKLIVQ